MSDEKQEQREEAADEAAEDLEVSDEAAEDVQGGGRRRLASDGGAESLRR